MGQVLLYFTSLGTRNNATAPVSGGTAVNVLGDGVASDPNRQGVSITNHSATEILWLYIAKADTAATPPTISNTTYNIPLAAGAERTIAAGYGIRIWAISSSAGNTCAFTAVELL